MPKISWDISDSDHPMSTVDWKRFKRDFKFAAAMAGLASITDDQGERVTLQVDNRTVYFSRIHETNPEIDIPSFVNGEPEKKASFIVAATLLLAHHDKSGSHSISFGPLTRDEIANDMPKFVAGSWNLAKYAWQNGAKRHNGFQPRNLNDGFAAFIAKHIDAQGGRLAGRIHKERKGSPREVFVEAEYTGYYIKKGEAYAVATIFGNEYHIRKMAEFGTTYGGPDGCFGQPCISERGHFHGKIFVRGTETNGRISILDGTPVGELVDGKLYRHGFSGNMPRVVSGDRAFCEVIAEDPRATTALTLRSFVDVDSMLDQGLSSKEFLALMEALEEKASTIADEMAQVGCDELRNHMGFLGECEEDGVKPW